MTLAEDAWVAREFATGRYQVDIANETGFSQSVICSSIERFCASLGCPVKFTHYGPHRAERARMALERYRGTFDRPVGARDPKFKLIYAQARYEHAWLLRAEGLTLQEVADRIGCGSRETARQIIYKFGRRVRRATRKTRFKILDGGNMTLSPPERDRLAARNKAIMNRWVEDTNVTYRQLGEEFGLSHEGIRIVIIRYCRAHPEEVRLKQRLENSKWRWVDKEHV